jgi:hypothetical protein
LPDRLSDLSDDILTHILSFAPTKEAASTTALSRRWNRPLWLDTATVNLDSRSHTTGIYEHNALYFPHPDGRVIKKVAIVLRDTHIPGDGLSKVIDAGVEELRLECQDGGCPDYTYATPSQSLPSSYAVDLSLDMLPLASLRFLDLTGCKLSTYSPQDMSWSCTCREEYERRFMSWSGVDWEYQQTPPFPHNSGDWEEHPWAPPLPPFSNNSGDSESEEHPWAPPYWHDYSYDPVTHWCTAYVEPPRPHITFPCLGALRLRRCATSFDTLRTMIDGAPMLADLRLESLSILHECLGYLGWRVPFRCPSVSTLVMSNLHLLDGTTIGGCHIELDAPRLRRLRYIQSMSSDSSFTFESTTPQLEQVHLATHSHY